MKKSIILLHLILMLPQVKSQDLGNADCDSLLLVSSWRTDNVKIFDGCDGSYIRDLDDSNLLDGPQTIFQDPNQDLIVVSESNNRLVKFDIDTLSNGQVISGDDPNTQTVEPGLIATPIGAIPMGDKVILSGYSQSEIIEVDTQNWQRIRTILPASSNVIQGADIGIALGPDGDLYVPGFDSDNILKINLQTLATSQVVNNAALDAPRSIIFYNQRMLVTGWRNNAILEYQTNGQFTGIFANMTRPTGMVKDGDDHILVSSDSSNTVNRISLIDGSQQTVITPGNGGLRGATYVYRLQKQTTQTNVYNHYWMLGVGEINGSTLDVPIFQSTRGPGSAFGENLKPDMIEVFTWGNIRFEFSDCNTGQMHYESTFENGNSGFASGSYPIFRLAINQAVQECLEQGFENVVNANWMSGLWYEGDDRLGEGVMMDVLDSERVIVTWYTYAPQADQ
ncbi:hypothetical protein [Marinicella sp. W31]|uniref:hypothetical protein n=1 Tax=Marinicella sp. W31 TaxID=3023713 RepID=UPI003757CB2A